MIRELTQLHMCEKLSENEITCYLDQNQRNFKRQNYVAQNKDLDTLKQFVNKK